MTRWLITGGCGFIGCNVVRYLLTKEAQQIIIIDNFSVGTPNDLAAVCDFDLWDGHSLDESEAKVRLVKGDILDEALALELAKDKDAIIHLAANTGVQPSIQDPRQDCLTNVVGTLNYLEAARLKQVKRFIFASSGGTVIGDCEPPINESMVPHPKAPYGASKSAGEGYCSAYYGSFGVETVALRFGNVYGPYSNHKNSVVAKFIRRALEGQVLEIYGDGQQTRDFIYIDDLVHAVYLAATVTQSVGGEVFQIATAFETTVSDIAERLVQVMRTSLDHEISVQHTNPLTGEIKRNFSDITKARQYLSWEPQVTLQEGLDKTFQWFLKPTG